MTISEYAKSRGKSVQAVYKQLRSKINREKLAGHIRDEIVAGRKIKCLDDEAIRYLDSLAESTRTIIISQATGERIKELETANQTLLAKYAAELEDKKAMQIQISELREEKLRISMRADEDKAAADLRISSLEHEAAEMRSRAEKAEAELADRKSWGLLKRIFG